MCFLFKIIYVCCCSLPPISKESIMKKYAGKRFEKWKINELLKREKALTTSVLMCAVAVIRWGDASLRRTDRCCSVCIIVTTIQQHILLVQLPANQTLVIVYYHPIPVVTGVFNFWIAAITLIDVLHLLWCCLLLLLFYNIATRHFITENTFPI